MNMEKLVKERKNERQEGGRKSQKKAER